MKNFLAILGAAVLIFLGLGWYLGWYAVKRDPNQSRLQVDINQEKISKDVQAGVKKGADKVQDIIDQARQNQNDSFPPPAGPGLKPPTPPQGSSSAWWDAPATAPKSPAKPVRELILDGWFGDKK